MMGLGQPTKQSSLEQKASIYLLDNSMDKSFRKENQMRKLNINFVTWKRGRPLPSKCKQLVANVYCKIAAQHPELKDDEIQRKTTELLGVDVRAVIKRKKEPKAQGKPTPTTKNTKAQTQGRNKQTIIFDDFTMAAIRQKVHDFYRQGEAPTISKITAAVNDEEDLPSFTDHQMHRLLRDLNFEYVQNKRRQNIPVDRDDIVDMRRHYLHSMRKFRHENRNMVYLGETCVNAQQPLSKNLHDNNVKTYHDAFLKSLSTEPPAQRGKDSCLMIIDAGGSEGFVPGCLLVFQTVHKAGNNHEEMDGSRFEEWFRSNLLPALKPRTVIVMDNAPCHSVRVSQFPTMMWIKPEIQSWLAERGIVWEHDMIKQELLALAEPLRKSCEQFVIDEIAKAAGHEVLRIPPYHSELNPIEKVWSFIKDYVARNNTSFKLDDVLQLTYDAFNEFKDDMWAGHIKHVIQIENEMWKLDGKMEDVIERILENSDDDSSSVEEDDDTESELE